MFTVLTIMVVGAGALSRPGALLVTVLKVVLDNGCSILGSNDPKSSCDAIKCYDDRGFCSSPPSAGGVFRQRKRKKYCRRSRRWTQTPACHHCSCATSEQGESAPEASTAAVQHLQMPPSTASGSATQIDNLPPTTKVLENGCSITGSNDATYSCDAGACFAQGGLCLKHGDGKCFKNSRKWMTSPACRWCWCSPSQQGHGGSAPEASNEAVQHSPMPQSIASGSAIHQIDDDCEISVVPSMASRCNPDDCWNAGGRCKPNGRGHCVPDLTIGWFDIQECHVCSCKVKDG